MQDWIRVLSRTHTTLEVSLVHPEKLDVTIFEKMAADDFCLRSMLHDPIKATIRYSIENLISLKDFLEQVTFEKEEGYFFLKRLFECAIAVNRNKPVLFDPSFVFVSMYGDTFYFLVVPLALEEWIFQKDQVHTWIQYLREHFKTTSAFEIPGYLLCFEKAEEFSLPNLVLGLDQLRQLYYPLKHHFFSFRKKTSFRLKEPVHPLYETSYIQEQETMKVIDDNQTQLIGQVIEHRAYLEEVDGSNRFDLNLETTVIGRSMASDIRLPDDSISLRHAMILYENDRYYIKDLKSRNKTYLNGKPVIRKMRLKNDMVLTFGIISYRFHQDEV